jgi:hypothetical protein
MHGRADTHKERELVHAEDMMLKDCLAALQDAYELLDIYGETHYSSPRQRQFLKLCKDIGLKHEDEDS